MGLQTADLTSLGLLIGIRGTRPGTGAVELSPVPPSLPPLAVPSSLRPQAAALTQALLTARPCKLQVTDPSLNPVELELREQICHAVTRECLGAPCQGSSWGQCQAPSSQLSRGGSETKHPGLPLGEGEGRPCLHRNEREVAGPCQVSHQDLKEAPSTLPLTSWMTLDKLSTALNLILLVKNNIISFLGLL